MAASELPEVMSSDDIFFSQKHRKLRPHRRPLEPEKLSLSAIVIDGGKAMRKAIEHPAEDKRHACSYRMRSAYRQNECVDALRLLQQMELELEEINPSAAASMREGKEETLTVLELRVAGKLRATLDPCQCQ